MFNKIKFGVFLPFYAFKTQKSSNLFNYLQDTVLACERLGYNSVWLDDHLMLKKMPILECWTSLSALSRVTKTIRLGTMVSCASFRNPALLAKMAATLDNISNGRLELGIGAGVQKKEHSAYGFPFPSTKDRIERLFEAVMIIKKLWEDEKASYSGEHFRIRDAACEPKPLQKPHPPIIIGGGGEKFTLKVTAQLADRFDWSFLSSLEEYRRKLKLLEKYCKIVGRGFNEIEKSCWPASQLFIGANKKELEQKMLNWVPRGVSVEEFKQKNFVGTPEECIDLLSQYVKLDVTQFMLFFGDLPDLRGLKLFASKVINKVT